MRPSQLPAWRQLPGWCTPAEGDHLYETARALQDGGADMAAEIGTYLGRSAVAIGLGCQEAGIRLYTIDHFRGNPEHETPPSREAAERNIAAFGLASCVTIREGESVKIAETWRYALAMLYIDASHVFQDVINDFAAWWPHLARGGCVLFHDSYHTDWPQVIEAVQTIAMRWPLEEQRPVGSIRGFRKR